MTSLPRFSAKLIERTLSGNLIIQGECCNAKREYIQYKDGLFPINCSACQNKIEVTVILSCLGPLPYKPTMIYYMCNGCAKKSGCTKDKEPSFCGACGVPVSTIEYVTG